MSRPSTVTGSVRVMQVLEVDQIGSLLGRLAAGEKAGNSPPDSTHGDQQ